MTQERLVSARDGGTGYGPSMLWWYFNFGYFTFGWCCCAALLPLQTATDLVRVAAPTSAHGPWIAGVLWKYLVLTASWYGSWHYFLYIRRVAPIEQKFKKEWCSGYCVNRDILLSLGGSLVAASYEVLVVLLWCTGWVPYSKSAVLSTPCRSLFWLAALSYWSDVHFWLAHRSMHPWFKKGAALDPGALLYRCVHAVHHKSHNPGPWSGLAMHPVEHLVYFTRSLICLTFAAHPAHFCFLNLRACLGPCPGHHGFASYGGSLWHYLHHAYTECNFGTSRVVPVDHFLGTFRDNLERKKAIAPDRSWNAVLWLFGLPYLVPLACLALVLP